MTTLGGLSRLSCFRTRTAGRFALLFVLVVLGAGLPARTAGAQAANTQSADDLSVDDDPAVLQARERLDETRAQLGSVSAELDAAAAAYEQAQAQHFRLVEEFADAGGKVEAAHANTAKIAGGFDDRIAELYKHPGVAVGFAPAVLLSRDPATALHRVELIEQMTLLGLAEIEDATRLEAVTADLVQQQRVIEVGTAAAAEERQRRADDLTLAAETAAHAVSSAEGSVADAVAAAERRIAEQREREEAARRAAALAAASAASAASVTGVQMPAVDGMFCPIGAPNGFIDSWGYPRSGGRTHQGVDMFAAYGMPVYATADGVIRVSYSSLGGLSLHLTIGNGDRFYHAHLSEIAVSDGQRVSAGEVIGYNGNSGNARSTPPHLHWQYHPGGGEPVNPYPLAHALCRGHGAGA